MSALPPARTPHGAGGGGPRSLTINLDHISDDAYADVANAIWAVVVATGHTGTMTRDDRVPKDLLNQWWTDQGATVWA